MLWGFARFVKLRCNEARKVISLRVTQLTPERGKETLMLPDGWFQVLELLQEQHNPYCVKKEAS